MMKQLSKYTSTGITSKLFSEIAPRYADRNEVYTLVSLKLNHVVVITLNSDHPN